MELLKLILRRKKISVGIRENRNRYLKNNHLD